jgi:type I restriction enzyme S subunit
MIDDASVKSAFALAEEYSVLVVFAASLNEVNSGSHRLEALFYGDSGYRAMQTLHKAAFAFERLGNLAQVYWPGSSYSYEEMKRTEVHEDYGIPFMSTAEMLQARLVTDSYVSRLQEVSLDRLFVASGSILVSRSGSIGNTVIVTEDVANTYVPDHALRLTPYKPEYCGLLYTFFQSQSGQFLITRNKSGGVIESIYEEDLRSLTVPVLPQPLRIELSRQVGNSCKLRVKANRLLDDAQEQVQRSCYLPDLKSFTSVSSFGNDSSAKIFVRPAHESFSGNRGFGEIRLDATYHEPVAISVAKQILQSESGTTLGSVVQGVRNSSLRKRIYVDDAAQGISLIGGKQLLQWRPMGVKYLSKVLTRNLAKETLQDGWTVVSCGGTLGRALFVHKNIDGWAASQHVMRLIPDKSKIFPGFLYAFIASPYAQVQIQQRLYESVINEIRDFQFKSIAIRVPADKGEAVHDTVVRAFDLRAEARAAEDRAIALFEEALHRGRSYVESEWGSEY